MHGQNNMKVLLFSYTVRVLVTLGVSTSILHESVEYPVISVSAFVTSSGIGHSLKTF